MDRWRGCAGRDLDVESAAGETGDLVRGLFDGCVHSGAGFGPEGGRGGCRGACRRVCGCGCRFPVIRRLAHLVGTVEFIVTGDRDAEVEVVVRIGSLHVIVTQKRKPYHKEVDLTRLGLQPRKTDIVVVKIGYLEPELYAMRADWIMALTPGGVDQDIEHLTYKRIERPMFPFDREMKDPDLSARMILSSDSL